MRVSVLALASCVFGSLLWTSAALSLVANAQLGTKVTHKLSTEAELKILNHLDQGDYDFSKELLPGMVTAHYVAFSTEFIAFVSLSGSDLLGAGLDAKQGFDLGALTRPLFITSHTTDFFIDSTRSFKIPAWQLGRRVFHVDVTTTVFQNATTQTTQVCLSAIVHSCQPRLLLM
jgi:hypothetical protein